MLWFDVDGGVRHGYVGCHMKFLKRNSDVVPHEVVLRSTHGFEKRREKKMEQTHRNKKQFHDSTRRTRNRDYLVFASR